MIIIPKKSLGQNFLVDKNIIEKIVNVIEIENKSILEVGPGTGNLTSAIVNKKPKKIFLIEKDHRLISLLKKEFKQTVNIIQSDVLKLDENRVCEDKLIVFGNLPYNISTEILCRWVLNLSNKNLWFSNLILMFQKEVADRILSDYNTSNYGRLSVVANWRLNVKKLFDISPNSFYPKPKVESSLLFFSPKKNFLKLKNPDNLEKITRIFFRHRRKMIKKSFRQIFSEYLKISNKYKINLNLRPQNINFDTYYKLTQEYEKLRG